MTGRFQNRAQWTPPVVVDVGGGQHLHGSDWPLAGHWPDVAGHWPLPSAETVRTVKTVAHVSGAVRKFSGATMRTTQKPSNIAVFANVYAGFIIADAKSPLELLFFAHWPHARFCVVAQHLNSTCARKSICLSTNARPLEPVRARWRRELLDGPRKAGRVCYQNVKMRR